MLLVQTDHKLQQSKIKKLDNFYVIDSYMSGYCKVFDHLF